MEIFNALVNSGCFIEKPVTSKAGNSLEFYINVRRLMSYPINMDVVIQKLEVIKSKINCDAIAGVPNSGLVLGSILAYHTEFPFIDLDGDLSFINQLKILLIEDVITTGKSTLNALSQIKKYGGIVTGIVPVVDRREIPGEDLENIPVYPLMWFKDFKR